jgi:predicted alpha/beta-hydrolase family hydrolase
MAASDVRDIAIPVAGGDRTSGVVYPARQAIRHPAALILAHGAGAGQSHTFITGFAQALSERGLDVVTFNFLYAERGRHVPDRMPLLVACYRSAIGVAREHVASARERLFIGGKSMGGRVATHVAADDPALSISGIVLLGYPLHPPGRLDQLRDAHLPHVGRAMLFVQGSRDSFGTPTELKPILGSLSPLPTLHTVEGGDHSFKITGAGAKEKQAAVYRDVQDTIVEWINSLIPSP